MFNRILFGLSCAMASSAIAQERPNIILIMCDDLGWEDVRFNGNRIIQTPWDHLAQEGIIFDRCYAGSAVSSPTRASVLTGRNSFRTGVFNANTGIPRLEEITLPELLLQQRISQINQSFEGEKYSRNSRERVKQSWVDVMR